MKAMHRFYGSSPASSLHASSRSRLLGLPLADRHAALTVACSLGHKLPRRALIDFLCRIILGDDVAHVQANITGTGDGQQRGSPCACGGQELRQVDGRPSDPIRRDSGIHVPDSVEPCAACKLCLERREWLDSFSARLLSVACRKLTWIRSLPEDERSALSRCLAALAGALAPPLPESSWMDLYKKRGKLPSVSPKVRGASASDCRRRERLTFSASTKGRAGRSSTSGPRGVSAILIAARRGNGTKYSRIGAKDADYTAEDYPRSGPTPLVKRPRRGDGEFDDLEGSPLAPPRKVAKNTSGSAQHQSGDALVTPADAQREVAATHSPPTDPSSTREKDFCDETKTSDAVVHEESEDDDCLAREMQDRLKSVAKAVVSAGARGSTSMDVQAAAGEVVSLLQASVSPSAQHARGVQGRKPQQRRQQLEEQAQPLEVICQGLGLGKLSGSDGAAGCGDDLILAVCSGFVTPVLSLRNCLSFVAAVLVPRARALSTPASRLFVTAASDIGKARPGVVIDGLVLPLMCGSDPSKLGSAQCELCTRLIKQVLPKHTLEAVLTGLCSSASEGETSHGDGGGFSDSMEGPGRACVWTELTMPVVTAAINLKPPLSDSAIGKIVRKVEVASESVELQKSLKFTTLVHGLVTRYGLQLKPSLPALRAAISRCSTFMVKAVLAALQRLEKK